MTREQESERSGRQPSSSSSPRGRGSPPILGRRGRDRLPPRHLARRLRRLAWLEDYAASLRRPGHAASARRSQNADGGHPARHVSFAYPGGRTTGVDDVSLTCGRAGRRVVGENGREEHLVSSSAASTTERGAASWWTGWTWRASPDGWLGPRRGVPGLLPLEFWCARASAWATCRVLDDEPRSAPRPGARRGDVVERLPRGFRQLGAAWPEEASSPSASGRVALGAASCANPPPPGLDEPTGGPRRETEHALFEPSAAARGTAVATMVHQGPVTISSAPLPRQCACGSHRGFRRRRVRGWGTHEALMAAGGAYAELYGIQQAANLGAETVFRQP